MTQSGQNDEIRSRIDQQLRERIQEHVEVRDAEGSHVGLVDKLEGEYIKLTKNDTTAHGQHHWIPLDWVTGADDVSIKLDKNLEEVRQQWLDSAPNQ